MSRRGLATMLALLILGGARPPAAAAESVEAMEQIFARWRQQHGVERGALAVAYGDRLVLAKGYGGLTAESRTLLASLSKAITATCVATLIRDDKVAFDSTLGELLGRGTQRYPAPRDPRLRTVTVAQLLTHRSGFGRSGGDPATGHTLTEVLGRRPASHARMQDLVPGVLRTRLEHEPGTQYVYTNASHLLLGAAIEAVTGQPYEDYCGAAVLKPQGIRNPGLHARWGVLGAFGGWSLTGAEYLAFLRTFAPAATVLNAATRDWFLSPAGKETIANGPLFYSLLYVRPVAGGHDIYHTGSWGYRGTATAPSGLVNDSIGTRATRTAFGASWFVAFEPRPNLAARTALDRDLHRAAETIRAWPETDLYPSFGLR